MLDRSRSLPRLARALVLVAAPIVYADGHEGHDDGSHAAHAQAHAADAQETPSFPAIPMRSGEASIDLGRGETLGYVWSAGTLPVPDDVTGEPRAQVFHIAYRVPVAEGEPERPVTFVFNGGPGSSSVWLHMGICGPKRIAFANERGDPTPPPYTVVDNEHTWLTFTDLVFIDPVTTGYSRPVEGVEESEFHGLDQDVSSVGDFIRHWITAHDAWGAPKYLCGESYGTTRAAGLAEYLQSRHAMYLSGVVLVSSAIDFSTLRFGDGNILPYPLFLPTYTATAWYHGKLPPDLQRRELADVLEEVEAFAVDEYTPALMKGDRLAAEEHAALVTKLARYTGTGETFIRNTKLRPTIWRFTKELLRGEDPPKSVGRFDSRFAGFDADPSADAPGMDASYSVILGPFGGAVNDYLRGELGVDEPRVYEILTGKVRPWDYGSEGNAKFVNVADRLAKAMRQNPSLRVYFQSGYYDLATPYFATDHVIAQMLLEPELRANVTHDVYPAGHMMYLHHPTLAQETSDARAFYEAAPDNTAFTGDR